MVPLVPFLGRTLLVSFLTASLSAPSVVAQTGLDTVLVPHQAAMRALARLDGVWRGTGWTLLASGKKTAFTQTIRVGPMGEGALKLLEGRSYGDSGQLVANNVEIFSYNPTSKTYNLRLYAQGNSADVPITPHADGFTLEYPDGTATIRFTIAVTQDLWTETAERHAPGKEPVRFLELTLQRVGDTDWPRAGNVLPH
jgi:hypothetical protein